MQPSQKRNAVIYCRVSTKEQVEEGNSLATQERICREYADTHGYELVAVYIEQGESAKTTDRPQLKKLMAFCSAKKNNVSAVIAYKIDRISRNVDDYSQIRMFMRRYNVEIKSTSEHFEDTPAGRFMENILANVAQFDNDVRAERSVGGMKEAMRNGRYVWRAPIGYKNLKIEGKVTISQTTDAALIRGMFEKISEDKYPLEQIRKFLNSKGISIPKSQFYRMVRNEIYAGWIIKFGERVKGTFKPIISEELFAKVQNIISQTRAKYLVRISNHPDFPLRRFFWHPSGKLMTGCWAKGKRRKYAYYFIRQFDINFPKDMLESFFKKLLNDYTLDAAHFEQLHILVLEKVSGTKKEQTMRHTEIKEKIKERKEKRGTLIDKSLTGVISDELCKEKLNQIAVEIFNLEQTLQHISDNTLDQDDIRGILKMIFYFPGDLWKSADIEDQIALQWYFFPKGIEIDKEGYRTPEICCLFKLKHILSGYYSLNDFKEKENISRTLKLYNNAKLKHPIASSISLSADNRVLKSNTLISQIPLPSLNKVDIESIEFWELIKRELILLAQLFKKNNIGE